MASVSSIYVCTIPSRRNVWRGVNGLVKRNALALQISATENTRSLDLVLIDPRRTVIARLTVQLTRSARTKLQLRLSLLRPRLSHNALSASRFAWKQRKRCVSVENASIIPFRLYCRISRRFLTVRNRIRRLRKSPCWRMTHISRSSFISFLSRVSFGKTGLGQRSIRPGNDDLSLVDDSLCISPRRWRVCGMLALSSKCFAVGEFTHICGYHSRWKRFREIDHFATKKNRKKKLAN